MTTIPPDSTAVQAPAKKKSSRILAVDILRGITIAAMILVNNPGGPEEEGFAPLLHAEWIGLTPTDLIFPTFMFIMGIHIAEPILQLLKSAVGIVLGSEQVSFGEMLVLPWQSLAQ